MKIKKIIELCKRNETVVLHSTGEGQWISDGAAAYPLWGMPPLDQESICTIYDIPDAKASKIHWAYRDGVSSLYDMRDLIDNERECEIPRLAVHYGGRTMIPVETSTGVEWMDTAYTSPLEEGYTLWERRTPDGQVYFAAKNGLELTALIMPVEVIDRDMVTTLERLAGMCRVTMDNRAKPDDPQARLAGA